MTSSIPFADHCAAEPGVGFTSQARPASGFGCEPGFIPPRCKAARRFRNAALAAAATDEIKVGGFQSAQPIALIDLNSDPLLVVNEIEVNQQSLFFKVEAKNAATEAAIQPGLGDITNSTPEEVRSGVSRFPPSPLTDQNNPISIFINNPTAGALEYDFALYWGNPFKFVRRPKQ